MSCNIYCEGGKLAEWIPTHAFEYLDELLRTKRVGSNSEGAEVTSFYVACNP